MHDGHEEVILVGPRGNRDIDHARAVGLSAEHVVVLALCGGSRGTEPVGASVVQAEQKIIFVER